MIRNVVVGRLHPDADPAAVQAALDAIVALPVEGCLDVRVGRDAGLRPGAWGFAITSDWVDADAYRVYDLDAEHNRIRAELFGPLCAEIARVQFEKDPVTPPRLAGSPRAPVTGPVRRACDIGLQLTTP